MEKTELRHGETVPMPAIVVTTCSKKERRPRGRDSGLQLC